MSNSNNFRVRSLAQDNRYMITDDGRVFSKTRIGGNTSIYPYIKQGYVCNAKYVSKTIKGRWLKLQTNASGYHHVNLSTNRAIRLVHRLVAETFIPNPNNKPHINHIDANKKNNHVSNLEWCTPSENIQHAYKLGRMNIPKGADRYNAILDWPSVREIRRLYADGRSQNKIASMFGIDQSNVSRIVNNKWWKEVQGV